jgi:hypothetical protein
VRSRWLKTLKASAPNDGNMQISKSMGQFTNAVVPHGEDEMSVDFYIDTSGEAPLQV